MKKILFIITQSEFGGAQRAFFNIATNLDREKYEITVAAGPEGDDEQGLLSALENKGIDTKHLKYLKRDVNPLFDLLGLIEIYKLIRKEKPKTLFLGSTKAGFSGSLAGYLAKVPKIIYRIGGWTFNNPWPNWKKKLYLWIEKWSARFKDVIINNAEADRKQAIKLGIKPKEKIITIYNGLNINKLKFLSREKARKELFKKIQNTNCQIQNTKIIGTIAHLYPRKGLQYLIRTAHLIINRELDPNHQILSPVFIIIGKGRERARLENLIKKYHLEKNVFLVGVVAEGFRYLKAFDIFVLPSLTEGFPWTILETMAAGIPIVATKVSAIPEVLKSNQNAVLVEPKSPKQLAEAIGFLIKNPELREKLAQEARRIVEQKFTLEKMVKEIEKLF